MGGFRIKLVREDGTGDIAPETYGGIDDVCRDALDLADRLAHAPPEDPNRVISVDVIDTEGALQIGIAVFRPPGG